jgi:hypothetical protein
VGSTQEKLTRQQQTARRVGATDRNARSVARSQAFSLSFGGLPLRQASLFFFTAKLLDTLTKNKGAEQDHGSHQHCQQQQQKNPSVSPNDDQLSVGDLGPTTGITSFLVLFGSSHCL